MVYTMKARLSRVQLRPDITIGSPVGPARNWKVNVRVPFTKIEPSKTHPDKPWMVTHFNITKPNGKVEEIESTVIVMDLTNIKAGVVLEVPAHRAHHIESLHLKAGEAGSQMKAASLKEAFEIVAEHLPVPLPYEGVSAAFEINLGQKTGEEGVISWNEAIQKGIANRSDRSLFETAKENVVRLNLRGSDAEKQAFVDEFNARLEGRQCGLIVRGGTIAPYFSLPRQASTKMFVVVYKDKDDAGVEHQIIATMLPGRKMPKLPTDGSFIGQYETKGVKEGTTVAQLIDKQKSGKKLNPAEASLVAQQKEAQIGWWGTGFIVPPQQA